MKVRLDLLEHLTAGDLGQARVRECKLDGKSAKPFFAASQKGAHELEILMR
jgi:hypothetical protein